MSDTESVQPAPLSARDEEGSLVQPPITIAAIDAGSNAIRMNIALASSPREVKVLEKVRAPVRLGRGVFTRQQFSDETIDEAVRTFVQFRSQLDRYDVRWYRAVATSATREARNRDVLVERVFREADIHLEVIDGIEEARLVRSAVYGALPGDERPDVIIDLGGGSLEINLLDEGQTLDAITLPIGTVRLMEGFEIRGAISGEEQRMLERYVHSNVRRFFDQRDRRFGTLPIACGGNVEALALIAPGDEVAGMPSLDLAALEKRLPEIIHRSIEERMEHFEVRQDRAEVMGIAAIVLTTFGRELGLEGLVSPGVGVREGAMRDLTLELFRGTSSAAPDEERDALLSSVRNFAQRLGHESPHAEHVRRLSVRLFDALRPLHGLDDEARLMLEVGALLHDIGEVVNKKSHHKHGEYIVLNGTIPGIVGTRQDLVGALVRHHRKGPPGTRSDSYRALSKEGRAAADKLCAILRVADALDWDHRRTVQGLDVAFTDDQVLCTAYFRRPTPLILSSLKKKADVFEEEFSRALSVRVVDAPGARAVSG